MNNQALIYVFVKHKTPARNVFLYFTTASKCHKCVFDFKINWFCQ